MLRVFSFLYAVFAYLGFLAVVTYFMAFLAGVLVPITVDTPSQLPLVAAIAIDVGLILLFAAQHSIMARPAFKRVWTKFVPEPIERATYVWASNFVLAIVLFCWQGIDLVIWDIQQPALRITMWMLYVVGFTMVPVVSVMINHFDLFGLRQAWLHLKQKEYEPLPFRTPLLYSIVRHPLYVAWAAAFWFTPTMTAGHFLFAVGMTVYMGLAAIIEESDLVNVYGDKYRQYQRSVPMFVPKLSDRTRPKTTESATM
ncbi:methanethiol S-methyltransferase [Bremerella sp. JC770]|uniref:methanethiol S-methyltransferase n=1 Tax=Bremerella sp. JC770 TaxID=3232137 RepID=UPI0034583635